MDQQGTQKQFSPLTCPLRANEDQDVIQIDYNTPTFVMAKEQIGSVRDVKTLGAVASPKGKTLH